MRHWHLNWTELVLYAVDLKVYYPFPFSCFIKMDSHSLLTGRSAYGWTSPTWSWHWTSQSLRKYCRSPRPTLWRWLSLYAKLAAMRLLWSWGVLTWHIAPITRSFNQVRPSGLLGCHYIGHYGNFTTCLALVFQCIYDKLLEPWWVLLWKAFTVSTILSLENQVASDRPSYSITSNSTTILPVNSVN